MLFFYFVPIPIIHIKDAKISKLKYINRITSYFMAGWW